MHTPLCFCLTLTEWYTIVYRSFLKKEYCFHMSLKWTGWQAEFSGVFFIPPSLPSTVFWMTEFGENVLLRRYNIMCIRFLLMTNSLKWVNHISKAILIAHESKIDNYSYWHYNRWFYLAILKKGSWLWCCVIEKR